MPPIKNDAEDIIRHAQWLIDLGYVHHFSDEYTIVFSKDAIDILVFNGRYSDQADVRIAIDHPDTERHGNGEPYKYSVFEKQIVESGEFIDRNWDSYYIILKALDLLKNNDCFFDIDFLKKNRIFYKKIIYKTLPENLKNIIDSQR